MPPTDRLSASLAPAAATAFLQHLADAEALLPFLLDLSPEERASLPKMGDKSRAFVERALELGRQDDSFLPRNLDLDAYAQDLALWRDLEPLQLRAARLLELVADTQLLAGSEAYLAALEVYAAAKRSGRGAGLDDLIDRVGRRFAARRRPSDTPTPV